MNLEIANRLVALRRERGLSQEDLAARLGVSRQAISKWERAESSPDTDNLIALARLYGVSLDALLLHTPAGEAAFPQLPKAPPYEGARDSFLVEDVEDRERMTGLVRVTCEALRSRHQKKRRNDHAL